MVAEVLPVAFPESSGTGKHIQDDTDKAFVTPILFKNAFYKK
jgi:hypothetical protein